MPCRSERMRRAGIVVCRPCAGCLEPQNYHISPEKQNPTQFKSRILFPNAFYAESGLRIGGFYAFHDGDNLLRFYGFAVIVF